MPGDVSASKRYWKEDVIEPEVEVSREGFIKVRDEAGTGYRVREDLIEGLVDSANETTLFISSHDLADIESFASHIAFLSEGRLQFSVRRTLALWKDKRPLARPQDPDQRLERRAIFSAFGINRNDV